MRFFELLGYAAVMGGLWLGGCGRGGDREVVVLYTSVDEPVARPIIEGFEGKYHVKVILKTDAEASKTVGLAERIRAEKENPRCDVYWGNEVFNTIALAEDGLLTGYEAPAGKDIPPQYKDLGNRWAGVGLRARVLVATPGKDVAHGHLSDLLNPACKGRVAMARPTAGTTGGQVAALYVLWGKEKADTFFRGLKDNEVKMLGGNSVVADSVASGQMMIGMTDNDDAENAHLDGVLPDQDGMGTLTMPTTVGLVAGAPHRGHAEELINYLLSPEVEKKLIEVKFAAWSVRDQSGAGVKGMKVNYADVAAKMPAAIRSAMEILEGRS